MPVPRIFGRDDEKVPEGTSHEYFAIFREANGSAIQLAAITEIRGWLDLARSTVAINGRVNVDLKNANGGTLVDGATLTPPQAGVGAFTWALTGADAAVVTTTATPGDTERHRITLRVAYTRSGGGEGQITHTAEYDVVKLDRI